MLYGSLVGQAYARAGEVAKATQMLAVIAPLVNERAEEQVAYAQLLKAEVAAAKGDYQTALQFLKPPGPNDSNASVVLTTKPSPGTGNSQIVTTRNRLPGSPSSNFSRRGTLWHWIIKSAVRGRKPSRQFPIFSTTGRLPIAGCRY